MSKNYAQLDENSTVINTIITGNDFIAGDNFIEYLDTNPAYIGGSYFEGYFYAPQPFASWSKDNAGNWVPPIPIPTDGEYVWDEANQQWVEFVA